jgi:hypothetical protein
MKPSFTINSAQRLASESRSNRHDGRAPRSRKTSASEHVSPLATMNLVLRTDRYSNPFAKILSTTIPTVPNIKVLPALSSRTSPVATSRLPDLTAMS